MTVTYAVDVVVIFDDRHTVHTVRSYVPMISASSAVGSWEMGPGCVFSLKNTKVSVQDDFITSRGAIIYLLLLIIIIMIDRYMPIYILYICTPSKIDIYHIIWYHDRYAWYLFNIYSRPLLGHGSISIWSFSGGKNMTFWRMHWNGSSSTASSGAICTRCNPAPPTPLVSSFVHV